MSVGLDCFIEVKNKETRKWEYHKYIQKESIAYDYAVFSYDGIAFLTGFKNDAHMPTIGEDKFDRGYPKDSDWLNASAKNNPDAGTMGWGFGEETVLDTMRNDNDYSISYVTLKELLDFDYDQKFLDRTNPNFHMGSGTGIPRDERRSLPEGEGVMTTVRESIGQSFLNGLEYLKELGDPEDVRVIYNLS